MGYTSNIKSEEKAAKATDLPELLTFFQQGYHNVDTSDWVAACAEMNEKIKELLSKVLEYGLFVGDETPEQAAQKFITSVRAATCVQSILQICDDKSIAADRTAIRKKMREVQASLKTFEIKPQDLQLDLAVDAYKAGLKMAALNAN